MKIKDLTLGQLVSICEEYKGSCGRCPLFNTRLHCFKYCDSSDKQKQIIKDMIKGNIDLNSNLLIRGDE